MQHQDAQQPASSGINGGQERPCGEGGCSGGGGGAAADLPPAAAQGGVCMKCRKAPAELVARGREPLCHPCLHEQLLSKVRGAVRLQSLILPRDAVALAFSGGHASAALLRFLALLRNPRADRAARGQVHFTLHIIHIDEAAALGLAPEAGAAYAAAVAAAAAPYCAEAGGGVRFHCVPLEAAFDEEGGQESSGASLAAALAGSDADPERRAAQRERLEALLAAVPDPTGRQDLARHLRGCLLLRATAALGCRRLARADCATSLAAHVVAAASKGCGYSLAGDVRLLDARHGDRLPEVFLPLREVSARELALVAAHWRLPLADAGAGGEGGGGKGGGDALGAAAAAAAVDKKNLNSLAAAFIAGMEAHNPGSVPNILNTISKLTAFPWNQPQQQQPRQQQPQQADAPVAAAAGDGMRQQAAPALLCPICQAPLADDELPGSAAPAGEHGHTRGGSGMAAAAQAAGCCLSCCAQILGGGGQGGGAVAAALPAGVQRQMAALAAAGGKLSGTAAAGAGEGPPADCGAERLRAQIADFLLDADC